MKWFSCLIFDSIISLSILTGCTSQTSPDHRLNEDFKNNKIGWVEEKTASHHLDIAEGKYYIESKDTTKIRSSTGSMASWYHYGLPNKYEITSSIELLKEAREETHFGILLISPSLEYNFAVYTNGWILVSEYDYNGDTTQTLFSKHIQVDTKKPTKMQIRIDEMNFTLLVNDLKIGTGVFKTESNSWRDLRLYTSTQSSILVDYLKLDY